MRNVVGELTEIINRPSPVPHRRANKLEIEVRQVIITIGMLLSLANDLLQGSAMSSMRTAWLCASMSQW